MAMHVEPFFDPSTFTYSYVVVDEETRACAVIDSVLDYDAAAASTSYTNADRLVDYVRSQELRLEWILETHVHADHLSAAPYLKQRLGGRITIGSHVDIIQETFGKVFNCDPEFARNGSQFDHLLKDGERFQVGSLDAIALHTPGHTPACMSYRIGDALFVGDTLFMPDYGTARCDFPGGDARALFHSIHKLYEFPDATPVFLCHDYKAEGREHFQCETSIGEQRRNNVHIHDQVTEEQFVQMRTERDAQLSMPALILPSVQVNMRAGELPEPEKNGIRYLKIPLDLL
ncbi:hypothetical protein GCM10011352_01870 [Marinobacterium zhoushanense]|uniref:Metallo-beta-lactamase domain-containing protein n=1 Tax=Marinobacterium zhoushanense TaxID=1679163 RepID=A0ABQ1JZU6_9GAMM|nr:MBL fold metallo-hydrolase [Marinobacterium zhoushanense]GGB79831.1 hypothetical protein GCM10011352_01870 [Marinobacterium zhoushanense]